MGSAGGCGRRARPSLPVGSGKAEAQPWEAPRGPAGSCGRGMRPLWRELHSLRAAPWPLCVRAGVGFKPSWAAWPKVTRATIVTPTEPRGVAPAFPGRVGVRPSACHVRLNWTLLGQVLCFQLSGYFMPPPALSVPALLASGGWQGARRLPPSALFSKGAGGRSGWSLGPWPCSGPASAVRAQLGLALTCSSGRHSL